MIIYDFNYKKIQGKQKFGNLSAWGVFGYVANRKKLTVEL
jgi:hypothetical protein